MTVIDPRETLDSTEEPVIAAANAPDVTPQGNGAVTPEQSSEPVDDNRAEELAKQQPVILPRWLSEKYAWMTYENGNGGYLRPHTHFLDYVRSKSFAAAVEGQKMLLGDTDEAAFVEANKEEFRSMEQTFRAISDLEGNNFIKHVVERATRAAVYAAVTQFELENWAEFLAKQGKDASQNQDWVNKDGKVVEFMRTAGILRGIIQNIWPTIDVSDAVYIKMANRHIYDTARFEKDKLTTPEPVGTEEAKAAEATRALSRRF